MFSWSPSQSFVTAPCGIFPLTYSIMVPRIVSGGARITHSLGAGKTNAAIFGSFPISALTITRQTRCFLEIYTSFCYVSREGAKPHDKQGHRNYGSDRHQHERMAEADCTPGSHFD